MRTARLVTACALAALPAPALAAEEDGNVWLGQFLTVNASEKVFVRLEAQERFTNDSQRLGQLLLRSLVAVRVAPKAHVGAGYAYVLTDPVGPRCFNEHRFYEEIGARLLETEGGVTLDSRTRLEQRSFEERAGTDWRLRQWLQLRLPLKENSRLVLYTEPFIDLSAGPVQRGGLAVWRNFAGVAIPLGKGVEVVPGYLNQTVFRDGPDRIDHVANVGLFVTF
ncbi:DUF2490 domain-containing protein [Erythrobacter sp. NE805]|uniref:DUF2490 domain-containing protein n=1 Tax=Erythrobacter sp. NE805 TaxID=3389875 RepID=UPI00396B3FF6